jgi:epoxyqueuosine reductase
MLEVEMKSTALREGAIRVGIARREAFSEAPPSADMRYEKPWANAVISFAVPLGTYWIQDFLGKVTRLEFKKVLFENYHKVYRLGAVIEECLKKAGFEAHNIVPNGLYRPDHTFEKAIPDPDLKPPLSLRYMAVGAGVGTFGWSGNVMVPGAWSNIYLGGVLTDALLAPDSLLEEKLCDDCRLCTQVCPMGFLDPKEKTTVSIGGREHVYNKKRGDYRCFIGCGGYTGIARDGKTVLPDDDSLLPGLYARLRDDPANKMATRNTTFGSKGVLDRSLDDTNPTCAHCSTVCSGPLELRRELRDLLFASGIVAKDKNGRETVKKTLDSPKFRMPRQEDHK